MRFIVVSIFSLSLAVQAAPSFAAHIHYDAKLINNSGQVSGEVMITPRGDHVHIKVAARELTPGLHGIHIHAVGKCEGPDFKSSGGHWNPSMKQHGIENPMGHHLGDLPNLVVGADGKGEAKFDVMTDYAEMIGDHGVAIIIHAGQDDMKSDPAGNSGARVLCAAFPATR